MDYLYETLIDCISYSIASVLNEHDISTTEKLMYEQDKIEGETWNQMADRVGFSDWYRSLGMKTKNIGDIYAKRRQRWLANNCKDQKVINNAIEDLEDCITVGYLNDDNFLEAPKDKRIEDLENQIKELKQRVDQLTGSVEGALNISNFDPDKLIDPDKVRKTLGTKSAENTAVEAFRNFKKKLKAQKAYIKRHRFKVLFISTYDFDKGDDKKFKDFVIDSLNNDYGIDCKADEIYFMDISSDDEYAYDYTGFELFYWHADMFKNFIHSAEVNVEVQLFDERTHVDGYYGGYNQTLYGYVIKLK